MITTFIGLIFVGLGVTGIVLSITKPERFFFGKRTLGVIVFSIVALLSYVVVANADIEGELEDSEATEVSSEEDSNGVEDIEEDERDEQDEDDFEINEEAKEERDNFIDNYNEEISNTDKGNQIDKDDIDTPEFEEEPVEGEDDYYIQRLHDDDDIDMNVSARFSEDGKLKGYNMSIESVAEEEGLPIYGPAFISGLELDIDKFIDNLSKYTEHLNAEDDDSFTEVSYKDGDYKITLLGYKTVKRIFILATKT